MRTARLFASSVLVLLIGAASAAAAPPEIRLLGPDGKPAGGAEVLFLDSSNVHLTENSPSLVRKRSRTDADGLLTDGRLSDRVCFLAFSGESAAIVCNHPFGGSRAETLTVTLSPAVRIRGRLDLPPDATAKSARVRALFSGGYEVHGIDAEIDGAGAFELPPLPASALSRGQPVLEVLVPGFASRTLPLGPGTRELVVPIRPWRILTGRVVGPDGAPVAGARLACVPDRPASELEVLLPDARATTGVDGRFRLPADPGDGFTLYVFSDDHAPFHVPVAGGEEPLELGDLPVETGRMITGWIREEDGRKVLYAFVSLTDERGVRVGSATVNEGEPLAIPHVGPGRHEAQVWVHQSEGIGGSRGFRVAVDPDAETLHLVVPMGVVLRLRSGEGKPVVTTDADFRVRPGNVFDSTRNPRGFSELRLRLRGPATVPVEVRVPGYEPAFAKVEVGADGRGEATLTLTRGAGTPHLPGTSPFGTPVPFPPGAKEPSPALAAVRPPDLDDRDDVVRYVGEVLATTKGRHSFSTDDPEVEKLAAVGAAHADVLIEALRRPGNHFYVLYALERVVGEPQRALVLARLAQYRDLAKIVFDRGWAKDARDTLVAGLEQVLDHPVGSPYVPTEWIEALASLRDLETYDLLKRYLACGLNPHMTWRDIHDLPGIDVSKEVGIAWDHAKSKRDDDVRMFAPTAARCGHLDALARLVASLSFPENDRRRPYRALETILELTEYDGPATAKDLQDWFEANREKLVFDAETRRFVVQD